MRLLSAIHATEVYPPVHGQTYPILVDSLLFGERGGGMHMIWAVHIGHGPDVALPFVAGGSGRRMGDR